MSSTTYDHQMSVEMEEWFFGDVAKEEDGRGGNAHPEGEAETGCPACGERWHECQCNADDPFSDEEA